MMDKFVGLLYKHYVRFHNKSSQVLTSLYGLYISVMRLLINNFVF